MFLLVACGAGTPAFPPPTLPPASRAPALADLPPPALPTRVPAAPAQAPAASPIVLTVWVTEDFGPGAERGGDLLATRMRAFETKHTGVGINYVLKGTNGKGGLVDWLIQLQELMPDRLPDVAIVDSRELDTLQAHGLLKTLNRSLPSGAYWDLFGPAQQIARRNGQWVDQPLVLELEHLVYDTRRVETPPASWDEVLARPRLFAFAVDGADTFLFHYLESGGALPTTAHPNLDAGIVQAILEYYQRAQANGNLSESTAVMKSAREVMPLFVSGQAPLAEVRARDFMVERARMPDARAAALPTSDGRAASLVSAWSLIVLSEEPARQQAAGEYVAWLSEPAYLAQWAEAASMVPASKSAFAEAVGPQDYADLLWRLLEQGIVAPGFEQQAPYAAAWHTAVQAVLNGQQTPDDAAFRAVQAMSQ